MAKRFGKILTGALTGMTLTYMSPVASAQGGITVVETVRGVFTGQCERDRKGFEYYTYRLNGQIIDKLSSECSLDGMSFVNPASIKKGAEATLIVIHEAMSARSNTIHIVNIPSKGPIGLITTSGETLAFHQDRDGIAHINIGNSGFAGGSDQRAEWTCHVDVNFTLKTFKSELEEPHEIGLTQDVCAIKLEEVTL